jgi:diguanylate cyclase (GGDEF)-like protein
MFSMHGVLHSLRIRGGYWIAALSVAFAALAAPAAHALDPSRRVTQYLQSSWNSESGLPQNSVHSIAQTPDGFVWLGTEEGLARFDGEDFVLYSSDRDVGLVSDYIQALAAAPDGTLWIGTDSGLTSFTPASPGSPSGAFHAVGELNGIAITALCFDDAGHLWIGTPRGLRRFAGGHLEDWSVGRGLPNPQVNAIVRDTRGTIWVATDGGVSHFDHDRFVTITASDGLPGNLISALAAAPDGSVWAGTLGQGLAQIRQGRVSLPAVAPPWKEVNALIADRDGSVWACFDRHGLGRYSHGSWEVYGTGQGLPSDRCTHAMLEGREGGLWIGLLDAGVAQLRNGQFAVFGKREGLSGNYVGDILQAQDGTMWFGADSNGLNHLLADGRVEIWDRRRGLPAQAVYSLLQSRDGSLWVGYRRGALARLQKGRISIYTDPQAWDTSINGLLEDREGRIWVGFFGKGLALFDHGVFRHLNLTWRVSCIAQAPDGALWVATDGDGIQRISGDRITHFTSANGLPSDHAMSVYIDREGSVWVSTASGGLSRIRGGRIVSWQMKQGMPASTVGSILEDNFGNLWMGSDIGIFRVSKQELKDTAGDSGAMLHPVLYGTANGLRSRETLYGSMPCAWKDRSGRLWFATIQGAAVVDPAHLAINSAPPPVWIESVSFDAHPLALRNGVRLGPGSGNLQVSFTAPSFAAPRAVRFRYRLSPFEENWTEAGQRRAAWYTNLPPGDYTFQVQAANSDGVWNRAGASFSFTLRPSLARTPAAYFLYVVLALLLAYAVVVFRTRHLTRRQEELTRTVTERTAQLESEKAALEQARHALQIQATHDSLTNLYNRGAMFEHLEREIARASRERTTLGVVIADLDHFKSINDGYGHLCGDDIIREVAARFRSATRGYDIVGRYGGEEFLILLPAFDLHHSPGRIEDLLDAIRGRSFHTTEAEIHLTCSLGVGTFRPDLDPPESREVIRRADKALYAAKEAGRNRACFEIRDADPNRNPMSQAVPSRQ